MMRIVLFATLLLAACGGGAQPGDDSAPLPTADHTAVAPGTPRPGEGPEDDEVGGAAGRLLPDLRISEPRELYIQHGADGVREIRFSTTISNLGDGPLLMVGAFNESSGVVSTVQRIELSTGGIDEYDVGRFVFNDGHDHWHLEDFLVFELWSLNASGQPDRVLATTGKMTFCLADSHPVEDPPANAAETAGVTSCDEEIQGISVGWEDIYLAGLPGQELDIPNLPDGRYAIRSIVDPDGLLLETDDENNESISYVDISGLSISYVE